MSQKKKLLVLDLNGVILARKPYHKRDKRNKSDPYEKRKYCDEFIDEMYKYYDIAIWSAARENKIEKEVVERSDQNILFIWSQNDTKNLWPRRSTVSIYKPLFLKELRKIWELFPQYDANSTVMLDNHLEKFESNPLGTCVLVPEFIHSSTNNNNINQFDETLNPQGEFVQHLKNLATCDHLFEYMKNNPCQYFPISHPLPPSENEVLQLHFMVEYCSSEVQKELYPDDTPQVYIRKKKMPGPKAKPFLADELTRSFSKRKISDWAICEKTDGIRYFLFILPDKRAFFIDRAWNFINVFDITKALSKEVVYNIDDEELKLEEIKSDENNEESKRNILTEILCPTGSGPTILDGELVQPLNSNKPVYLIFDVIRLDGYDIGQQVNLLYRLSTVNASINEVNNKNKTNEIPFELYIKKLYPLNEIERITNCFVNNNNNSNNNEIKEDHFIDPYTNYEYPFDGLVFTPTTTTYYPYTVTKWKPKNKLTIDFKIYFDDVNNYNSKNGSISIDAFVTVKDPYDQIILYEDDINTIKNNKIYIDYMKNHNFHNSFIIVESNFDSEENKWKFVQIRKDKTKPNSIHVARKVKRGLEQNLTLDELINYFNKSGKNLNHFTKLNWSLYKKEFKIKTMRNNNDIDSERKNEEVKLDNDPMVASHYDQMQEYRNQGKEKTHNIHYLRKLNNFIKATLFVYLKHPWFSNLLSNDIQTLDSLRDDYEQLPLPDRLKLKQMPNKPKSKSKGKSKNQNEILRTHKKLGVLDLACGRGGDIFKWWNRFTIEKYVGIDISPVSIKEASDRGNRVYNRYFGVRDISHPFLFEDLKSHGRFNTISCQFAFHYICTDESRVRIFFQNINKLMHGNGTFIFTCMDWKALYYHFNNNNSNGQKEEKEESENDENKSYMNSISKIEMSNGEYERFNNLCSGDENKSEELDCFGISYNVNLGDALEGAQEYIVYLPKIIQIAKEEANLDLFFFKNFGKWVNQSINVPLFVPLLDKMDVCDNNDEHITDDEWNISQLYCAIAFQRHVNHENERSHGDNNNNNYKHKKKFHNDRNNSNNYKNNYNPQKSNRNYRNSDNNNNGNDNNNNDEWQVQRNNNRNRNDNRNYKHRNKYNNNKQNKKNSDTDDNWRRKKNK